MSPTEKMQYIAGSDSHSNNSNESQYSHSAPENVLSPKNSCDENVKELAPLETFNSGKTENGVPDYYLYGGYPQTPSTPSTPSTPGSMVYDPYGLEYINAQNTMNPGQQVMLYLFVFLLKTTKMVYLL